MRTNREILLTGAIRVNRGNGHVFYKALKEASREELESAFRQLTQYSWAKYHYSYWRIRKEAIENRLKEIGKE